MRRKRIYGVIFTILTFLTLFFIFGNSSSDGATSGRLSRLVLDRANGLLDKLRIPFELTHFFIRKLAHFVEFSVLGVLLTITVRLWRSRPWRFCAVWLPLTFGLCVASLDELLQTFVPGRNGSPMDTLLDFCGVLWASLTVSALLTVRRMTSAKRELNTSRRRSR